MIRAAEFDISFQSHRVIGHHQRIHYFVKRKRTFFRQTPLKIITLENLLYRNIRRKPQKSGSIKLVHPARVEIDDGLFLVEQFEDLCFVSLRVGFDLFTR